MGRFGMSRKTVVILIHGIRTEAWWQDRVSFILEHEADATVIPLKYGYFDLLRFWCPFGICRDKPIKRLHDEIADIREQYKDFRLVVIAHSYGTYAFSRILLANPYFKFDRVILCGSIIRESFDWSRVEDQILAESKRDGIINECGTKDVWPVLARSASWDYGASGTYGFGTFDVRDRFHPNRHSDFFQTDFVRTYWVPAVIDKPIDFSTSDAPNDGAPSWFGIFRLPLRRLVSIGLPVVIIVAAWNFFRLHNLHVPEMVQVPAGSFLMGSAANVSREGPQHFVTVSGPLAVARYSVTFVEWDACVDDGGCNRYRPNDLGWGRDRRPVVNVSWFDAKNYTAWLSKKTGQPYRLPTEAEREYFARAGTNTKYWWGDDINSHQANFSSVQYGKTDSPNRTMPVDAFEPNPWNIFQVHGNIWEWVEDCAHFTYAGAPTEGIVWTNGADCALRMLRGGGWDMDRENLRSTNRGWNKPELRSSTVGFRVVKTLGKQ
jgi:formylglycine-generating enzyme required for sulfatase activity/pimeloyl-ACP methyl ester carboxylesterase